MATEKKNSAEIAGSTPSLHDLLIAQGMSQWMVLVQVSFEVGIRGLEFPKGSSDRDHFLKLAFDVRAEADRLFALLPVYTPEQWQMALEVWAESGKVLHPHSGAQMDDVVSRMFDRHYRRCRWFGAVMDALTPKFKVKRKTLAEFCKLKVRGAAGEWIKPPVLNSMKRLLDGNKHVTPGTIDVLMTFLRHSLPPDKQDLIDMFPDPVEKF